MDTRHLLPPAWMQGATDVILDQCQKYGTFYITLDYLSLCFPTRLVVDPGEHLSISEGGGKPDLTVISEVETTFDQVEAFCKRHGLKFGPCHYTERYVFTLESRVVNDG